MVLSVLFAVASLVAIVWIGRMPTLEMTKKTPEEKGPKIASKGPHPKAVVESTEYNFGDASLHTKGTHTFTIRNDGEADLVLVARPEDHSCQCTVAALSSEAPLPPGKSVDVTLNWEVKARAPEFRHWAIIRTNDPEHKEIKFDITGKILEDLIMVPAGQWDVGVLSASEPSIAKGVVYSPLKDGFTIEKFECANSLVSMSWEPFTDELKEEHHAKSGYSLMLTVAPGAAVGPFSEKAKLLTNLESANEVELKITGSRPGPIDFVGPGYQPEHNYLMLGEFPAKQGKEVSLLVFAREFDDELKLLNVEQKYNSVEIELQPAPGKSTGTARRYMLKVKVPPGPSRDRQRTFAEKAELHFNHPGAEKVRLIVDFLSTDDK